MDPSQLCLTVVGDVRADEVRALAHAAFGRSRGSAAPPPPVPAEPPRREGRHGERQLPIAQTHLVVGFEGARILDPWRWGLEVLSTILSGQGGRLFLELRDKKSLAYSVTSSALDGLEPGYFTVYIGTSPDKEQAALDGIREQLTRIREEPVSEAELARAKRNLIGGHEIGLQRNSARAGLLALDHLYGLESVRFERYAELIEAITVRDVQEAARRVIDFDRMISVRVGPGRS